MKKKSILFIGPFPPVVHGQSVSTAHLARQLQKDGINLQIIDINSGTGVSLVRQLKKIVRHLKAIFAILCSKKRVVYISVNANVGIYLTAMLAFFARLQRSKILLHHHTRSHLSPDNKRMQILCWSAGATAIHIGICKSMCDSIVFSSSKASNVQSYSNIGVVEEHLLTLDRRHHALHAPFILGIFGNLTIEKGLLRAIEAFRLAQVRGLAKNLVIGGFVGGAKELHILSHAKNEMDNKLIIMGPLYGEEKLKFFKLIDVFLFPSLYRNETQGIVNLEALAAGIPVLAYSICCTQDDLQGSACKAVSSNCDFAEETCNFLHSLPSDGRFAARQRFDYLLDKNRFEYSSLKNLMF